MSALNAGAFAAIVEILRRSAATLDIGRKHLIKVI